MAVPQDNVQNYEGKGAGGGGPESHTQGQDGGLPEPTRPQGAVLLSDQQISAPASQEAQPTTGVADSIASGEGQNNENAVENLEQRQYHLTDAAKPGNEHSPYSLEYTQPNTHDGQDRKGEGMPGNTVGGPAAEQQEKKGLLTKLKDKLPGRKHQAAQPVSAGNSEDGTPAPPEGGIEDVGNSEDTPATEVKSVDTPASGAGDEGKTNSSPNLITKLKNKLPGGKHQNPQAESAVNTEDATLAREKGAEIFNNSGQAPATEENAYNAMNSEDPPAEEPPALGTEEADAAQDSPGVVSKVKDTLIPSHHKYQDESDPSLYG